MLRLNALSTTVICLISPLPFTLWSAENGAAEPTQNEEPLAEPQEPVSPWSRELSLGLFVNQSAAHNRDESRDTTIAATTDAISYRLSLDGAITWTEGPNSISQKLRLRYGRVKEEDSPWRTNSDEVRYDIMARHVLAEPHFTYVSGRTQTVFADPATDDPFTPGLAFISAGYGQQHKNLFVNDSDNLQGVVGIRAQQRWGASLDRIEKDLDVGFEARLSYEQTIREGIDWRFEIESFAPFDDLGHITTWAELGIDIAISEWVIAKLSARAYYETQPDDATTGLGYDSLSLRQEALIGLSWSL